MPAPDGDPGGQTAQPGRGGLSHSLAARLVLLLLGGMAVTFAVMGWTIISQHRAHLESAAWSSADRASDIIERSATYSMMRNDRDGLLHIIDTIAAEPGVVGIRIYNQEGRISHSSQTGEEGTLVALESGTCAGCHASGTPLARMDRHDRFRIEVLPEGERVLGVINPIENHENCSSAACHAHPPGQKILGLLETRLSLAPADAALAEGSGRMVGSMLLAAAFISLVSGAFVYRVVHRPVKRLTAATRRLSRGELGFQIRMRRADELGELAGSFNRLSVLLKEARDESDSWARTLEERVEEKSRELQQAHDHVVHVEKMASLGKLAATVAHEINNPLSGILTYARLIRRWVQDPASRERQQEAIVQSLVEIETESRRCGEIVKNLLMFSRSAPVNFEPVDLNALILRCVKLVNHKMELAAIEPHLRLDEKLPDVVCDRAQVEQIVLALVVNAIEAMPRGGSLEVSTAPGGEIGWARFEVSDDGPGIPADQIDRLFEPFFTTKDKIGGVGLGLAVSREIVSRHGGHLFVTSDPGSGTTFTVELPPRAAIPADEPGHPQEAHGGAKPVVSLPFNGESDRGGNREAAVNNCKQTDYSGVATGSAPPWRGPAGTQGGRQ
jgi:two-component system NtrC family sensor kinase